jgi:hypothetical protein
MHTPALRFVIVAAVCMPASMLVAATAPANGASPASVIRLVDAVAPAPTIAPAAPIASERFTVTGAFPEPGARPIELQRLITGIWSTDKIGSTQADGSYSFVTSTTQATVSYRVTAAATSTLPAVTSDAAAVTTVPDSVSLSILRDGSTSTATARGTMSPVRPGRLVARQYLKSGVWTQIGSKRAERVDGTVRFTLDLTGKAPYVSHAYRLVVDGSHGSKSIASPTIKFMPGPVRFGPHVVRIRTVKNVALTTKGVDFPGSMTIDGGPLLDLEKIGLRGNSTALMAKKPYKLKFTSSQQPFGMPKGKRFNLLATYIDWSAIRDKVGLDLGAKMTNLAWTPKNAYTELFMNDEYQGAYLLTEAVKIDPTRVNVDKAKGVILEIDPKYVAEGLFGFTTVNNTPVSFKDPDERKVLADGSPDPEGFTDAKFAAIEARAKAFETALYGKSYDPTDGYPKYLDIPSAVDYYLVKEFTKDSDADFNRSHFFSVYDYTDPNGKFVMGPVWDFDRSAGVRYDNAPDLGSPQGWWMRGTGTPLHPNHTTHWYVQLTKDPAFLRALEARWAETRLLFKDVGDVQAQAAANALGTSAAANDRARWLGQPRVTYNKHSTTYQGEVTWAKNWYTKRFSWMDSQL